MSSQNLDVKVNAFLNAVELLFHSNNTEQKISANKFIIEQEKNPDSWDVACQILQKDNLSEEVYFNALQILKNKIKFDFGNFIENPTYIQNLLTFFESNIDKFKNSKNWNYLQEQVKAENYSGLLQPKNCPKSWLQKALVLIKNQSGEQNDSLQTCRIS